MDYQALGLFTLFLVVWIVLVRWVLPWLGLPTCSSGGCPTADRPEAGGRQGRDAVPADERSGDGRGDHRTWNHQGTIAGDER